MQPINGSLQAQAANGTRGRRRGRVHRPRARRGRGAGPASGIDGRGLFPGPGRREPRRWNSRWRRIGRTAPLPKSWARKRSSRRTGELISSASPRRTSRTLKSPDRRWRPGFNVVCDKPMTIDLGQAEALARLVERSHAVFAVTHNYTGYPMVRQARELIAGGELGEIQAIRVSYVQGGLRAWSPGETPTRGAWKADPAKAGPAGALGDIGSHAFNLLRYVTGLRPVEVSCQLAAYFPGRRLGRLRTRPSPLRQWRAGSDGLQSSHAWPPERPGARSDGAVLPYLAARRTQPVDAPPLWPASG